MDSHIKYLLSLRAIRERAQIVWQAAEAGQLAHFDFHEEKLGDVADFVISVIQVLALCLAKDHVQDDELTIGSVILDLTNMTLYHPMVVGSISRLAMCRASRA